MAETDKPVQVWLLRFEVWLKVFQRIKLPVRAATFPDSLRLTEFCGHPITYAQLGDGFFLWVSEGSESIDYRSVFSRDLPCLLQVGIGCPWGKTLPLKVMIPSGELLMTRTYPSAPFWLFFSDLDNGSWRRVLQTRHWYRVSRLPLSCNFNVLLHVSPRFPFSSYARAHQTVARVLWRCSLMQPAARLIGPT